MVAAIAPSSVKAGTPRNRTHLSHIRKEQIKKTKVKEDRGEMYPLYWTPSKEGTFCVIRLNLS